MTEQRRRLERALRGCAERGVPDVTDPWPRIRARITGEQTSSEDAPAERPGEERVMTGPRRRSRFPQIVPNTPLGWTLAVLSVLLIGAGIYSASVSVGGIFGDGPPGGVAPSSKKADDTRDAQREERERGSEGARRAQSARQGGAPADLLRYELPGIEGTGLIETVGATRTADGARVTVERVYADETAVVVAYSVQDLSSKGEKGVGLMNEGLQPVSVMDSERDAPSAPSYSVDLTDAEGGNFAVVDGGGMTDSGYVEWYEEVFEARGGLEPSGEHRFRLEIPLSKGFPPEGDREPDAGPFVFDFTVPVHPTPVVEVNETETVEGITLTLKRVVNSPGRPQAVVCFKPPDDEHSWAPIVESAGLPTEGGGTIQPSEGNCWSAMLGEPVAGPSSVTVTKLTNIPKDPSDAREMRYPPKGIRGPWTFEFRAPSP